MISKESIGIDIGRVISQDPTDAEATSSPSIFSDDYLNAQTTPHSLEVISQLRKQRFGENMHLISKVGPVMEDRTRKWLDHIDFFNRTGMDEERLFFCRNRSDKAPLAVELGLTHFIDDRIDIIDSLSPLGINGLLFFPTPATGELRRVNPTLAHAYGWIAVKGALLDPHTKIF